MSAFAQRCCGKDTKWQAGSLKVYGFLTKSLMKRILSNPAPAEGNAITGARRGQTPRQKVATRRFDAPVPSLSLSESRWKPGIRRRDSARRFAQIRGTVTTNQASRSYGYDLRDSWQWLRQRSRRSGPEKVMTPHEAEPSKRGKRVWPLHYEMKSVLRCGVTLMSQDISYKHKLPPWMKPIAHAMPERLPRFEIQLTLSPD